MTVIEKFENQLLQMPKPQSIALALAPAALVLTFLWVDTLPTQDEEYDQLLQQQAQLERNIQRKSPRHIKAKIKKDKQKLLTLKTKVDNQQDDLNFLYAKLSNLELNGFDELKWTLALKKILKKSLSLHLSIDHIKNNNSQKKDKNKTILPQKYVEIAGKGKYGDTLKYLNFIESSKFLLKIQNINLTKLDDKDEIAFKINFTIYGVNL